VSRTKENISRSKRLRPLAGLLAMGLAAPAFADPSGPFPTYVTGPQVNGSYVVSDGQIITSAGRQVDLGDQVRAKAVALNPNGTTAAVLTLGAIEAVEVFDTRTGDVLQNYLPFQDRSGSFGGIAYSADGKFLLFSQDSSNIAIANVSSQGLPTDYAHVGVPPLQPDPFIQCFRTAPPCPIGCHAGLSIALTHRIRASSRSLGTARPPTLS
jgi:hypothetical protein